MEPSSRALRRAASGRTGAEYDRAAVRWGTQVLAGCTAAAAAAAAAIAAVPAPSAAAPAVGVNNAGTSLLLFDTAIPGTMTPVPISWLGAGETISGIDRRPATGALYGLGVVNGGATDALRLYRIDPATGAATAISAAPVTATAGGTDYGFDFNPLVDRLRVVNDGNENLRLNPNNGTLSGDDTNLTDPGLPDSRPIEGIAYSSNVAPPFGVGGGVGSTTVFGIAPFTDELVTIGGFAGAAPGGPNGGVVSDEKPLGFNAGSNVNFDIADFAASGFLTSGTSFGTVNLGTGTFTLIGSLAQALDGFTVLPATTVTLDPRTATTSEAAGAVTITVTRSSTASPASVRVTTEQTAVGVSETDTAVSGGDFQPLDTRVNFVGDQTQATVTIPIVADGTAEGEEAFTVFLADPGPNTGLGVNTSLGADRATVTIAADPGAAAAAIAAVGQDRTLRGAHPRSQLTEAVDARCPRAHRALRVRRSVCSDLRAQALQADARHGEGKAHQGGARQRAGQAHPRREARL